MERLRSIDIAKGIAMLCVVLGHMNNYEIAKYVFTFHVPIFFLITGYFITAKKTVKVYIKEKARTLLVPYVITSFVIIVLGTIIGGYNGVAKSSLLEWSKAALYGAGDTYYYPFYIRQIGAIWFLWATFWGSTFLRCSLQMNGVVRLVFITILFLAGYYTRFICWFPFSIQAGACATFFMYVGYLYRQVKDTIPDLPKEVKVFCVGFAACVWIAFTQDFTSFWLVHCDFGRGILDIFSSLCACGVFLLICKLIDKKIDLVACPLAFIGRYSIYFLCIHIIELDLIPWASVCSFYGVPDEFEFVFILTCKYFVIIGLTWILSRSRSVEKLFALKR